MAPTPELWERELERLHATVTNMLKLPPQHAYACLRLSVSQMHAHYGRACLHGDWAAQAPRFDAAIEDGLVSLMRGSNCEELVAARCKLPSDFFLPLRMGGGGFRRLARIAPAAFLGGARDALDTLQCHSCADTVRRVILARQAVWARELCELIMDSMCLLAQKNSTPSDELTAERRRLEALPVGGLLAELMAADRHLQRKLTKRLDRGLAEEATKPADAGDGLRAARFRARVSGLPLSTQWLSTLPSSDPFRIAPGPFREALRVFTGVGSERLEVACPLCRLRPPVSSSGVVGEGVMDCHNVVDHALCCQKSAQAPWLYRHDALVREVYRQCRRAALPALLEVSRRQVEAPVGYRPDVVVCTPQGELHFDLCVAADLGRDRIPAWLGDGEDPGGAVVRRAASAKLRKMVSGGLLEAQCRPLVFGSSGATLGLDGVIHLIREGLKAQGKALNLLWLNRRLSTLLWSGNGWAVVHHRKLLAEAHLRALYE